MANLKTAEKIFKQKFGSLKDTVAIKSPTSFLALGDHTHYNEGILLSAVVDSYCFAILRKRNDQKISIWADNPSFNFTAKNFSAVKEKAGKNFISQLCSLIIGDELLNSGFECVVVSDVPTFLGLGPVASIQLAVLAAIKHAFKLKLNKTLIAEYSISSSLLIAGKMTNSALHYAILSAKRDNIFFSDLRSEKSRYYELDKKYKIVICDTGMVIKDQKQICNVRIEECEVGVRGLRLYIWGIKSLRDVKTDFLEKHSKLIPNRVYKRCLFNVLERHRVEKGLKYLRKSDIPSFGNVLSDSHLSLKFDYDISYPETDFLFEKSNEYDEVISTKLLSCSSTRAVFNIVEADKVSSFASKIKRRYKTRFNKPLGVYSFELTDGLEILY